mmetsp:Transcript_25809/g.43322  ORF Transcript_25809/g.43322 Transcript_25809/m.43322 type:complete len:390 (+) Transcript_25809:765-1934(+)
MLGANGEGDMLPLFLVVKCSCKDNLDLTKSRVLQNYTKEGGPCHGWEQGVWRARHPNKKGEMVNAARPYLRNPETLDVVTVQNKAWNDGFAYRMRIALQLKPYREKQIELKLAKEDDKFLMVADNCGCHKTKEVLEEFIAAGWLIEFFPPNMTSKLQPMDLVVNAPCKSAMRRRRVEIILEYFGRYKDEYAVCSIAGRDPPKYSPPAPALIDGIVQMLELQFKKSIKKCFENVGLCRTKVPVEEGKEVEGEETKWMVYETDHRGSIKLEEHSVPKVIPDEYCVAATLLDMGERPTEIEDTGCDDEEEEEVEEEQEEDEEDEEDEAASRCRFRSCLVLYSWCETPASTRRGSKSAGSLGGSGWVKKYLWPSKIFADALRLGSNTRIRSSN